MLPTADSAQPGEAAWVLTLLEYFGAKWDIDLLVNVRMRLWQEIGKFKKYAALLNMVKTIEHKNRSIYTITNCKLQIVGIILEINRCFVVIKILFQPPFRQNNEGLI